MKQTIIAMMPENDDNFKLTYFTEESSKVHIMVVLHYFESHSYQDLKDLKDDQIFQHSSRPQHFGFQL